jgi:hypothetical protein
MRGFSVIVPQPENAKQMKINEMVEILASLITQSWRPEKEFSDPALCSYPIIP